jgi:hypothetical protein
MPSKPVPLIWRHREFWKRDRKNFDKLKNKYHDPLGVYALYNGMTPVYFGQGRIGSRLRNHDRSRHRKGYWDHFSWYEIGQKGVLKDLETLFLRILPVYLHMLNRQRGLFVNFQLEDKR